VGNEPPSPGMFTVISTEPISTRPPKGREDDYDATYDLIEICVGQAIPYGFRGGQSGVWFGEEGIYLKIDPAQEDWFSQIDQQTMAIWTKELGRRPVSALVCHFEYDRTPWYYITSHAAWRLSQQHPRAKIALWDWQNRRFQEFYEVDWESLFNQMREDMARANPKPGGQRF